MPAAAHVKYSPGRVRRGRCQLDAEQTRTGGVCRPAINRQNGVVKRAGIVPPQPELVGHGDVPGGIYGAPGGCAAVAAAAEKVFIRHGGGGPGQIGAVRLQSGGVPKWRRGHYWSQTCPSKSGH